LGLCAADSAIAAAAHFARDDGGAQCVLGAPVGGIERRIEEEAEDGLEFGPQMRREAAGIGESAVADLLGEELLRRVVQFGTDRKVISFSPFEGDVERGVLCGLSVEAKLSPFINTRTLKASGINMSPMVLKVAKTHE